jgi:thiol-disulfide isomerase/thioredoxin
MKAFAAILAVVINFAFTPSAPAAPKIEERVVAPSFTPGIVYTLSPKGMHVATTHGRDGKTLVTVDGVDGPLMDSILPGAASGIVEKISTDGYYTRVPQKWTGPVAFSPNGERHAYAGQIGKETVVFLDGKEVFRGPAAPSGPAVENLQFSPDSQRLFFHHRTTNSHQSYQLMMDGKPVTPPFEPAVMPVFSADGSRWALAASRPRNANLKFLVIDGKEAGYAGEQPQFTPDGKRLVCIVRQWQKGSVLVDGKETVTGFGADKFVISPTGDIGAIMIPASDNRKKLFLNGKAVVDDAADVVFSPDGKRWAARCGLNQKSWVILNDGTRHKEYGPIANLRFTPDSSKLVYVASIGDVNYVVTDGKESAGYKLIHYRPVFSETGNSFFYTAGFMMGKLSVHYNDHIEPESLSIGNTTISPDGKRWAYYSQRADNTVRLMVNGQQTGPSAMQQGGQILFSPDSKHMVAPLFQAYWFDDRRIVSEATPIGFTPDSRHLIFRGRASTPGGETLNTYFINGDLVAKVSARGSSWSGIGIPKAWEQQPDGSIVFVGADPVGFTGGHGPIKRITVTPAPESSYAAWLVNPTITDYSVKGAAPTTTKLTATPAQPASAASAPKPATVTPPPAPRPAPVAAAPKAVTTPAASAAPLTWNDLVRRPETRPESCTVKRDYRFQSGATVRTGTRVNIMEVKPAELVVGAPGGITFAVKPDETDALAVAQAAWAQLTPAQRDLTYPALMQRTDLWPYRVKLMAAFNLEGRKLRAGDTALLLKTEGSQLLVAVDDGALAFNVNPPETDLMAQARAALAVEHGAPGRLIEEFAGKLVNPLDGKPAPLDTAARPPYVVLYRGANWCPPCQVFAPQLVAALKEKPAGATVIYVSADKSPAEAKAYVTKLGVAWPTIYYANRGQLPAFADLFGNSIPQLVVTDRGGKVLIDSAKIGQDRALAELKKLQ